MSETPLGLEVLPTDKYPVTRVIESSANVISAIARDNNSGALVFVKAKNGIGSLDNAEILANEAEVLDSLDHPQIPKLLDSDFDAEVPNIVTEVMPGSKFIPEWLSRFSAPEFAARICLSTLGTLEYVHGKKLAHRDVKTSNLIFSWGATTSLVDFELAERLDGGREIQDRYIATAEYVAPEVCYGEGGSVSTDIYSMGVVMYELLYGKRPFEHKDPSMVIRKQCNEPIKLWPWPASRDIPLALRKVIARATQKMPHNRYGSAGEMAEDIEQYLATA